MEKGSSAGADVSTAWQDRRDGDTVNASASLVMILRPLGGSVSQPAVGERERARTQGKLGLAIGKRILQDSLARHWARDWRALALTQVHHGSRLSDSCEDGVGEALSSVLSTALAAGKLIHNLLCDGRVKND